MKTRIVNIAAFWLLGIISTFAQNAFSIDNVSVVAGQTVALGVKLKNNLTVAGLGFTLTLPEGMSLAVDGDGEPVYSLNEERAKSTKFSVFSVAKDNGTYGFRVMPTSTSVIQGTDGIILSLQLQVDSKTASGTFKGQLTENSLTVKEDNNALRTEKLSNGSFSVNVTAQSQEVTTDNSIYVEDLEVVAGQTIALDVKLKNDVTVAGLGFTLTLPEGMSLVVDGDGEPVYSLNEERAKSTKFSVISSANENGTYGFRIMPTSTSVIQGTDGIILSLQLQVDSKTASGTYKGQLTENSLTVKEDNNALRTEVLDDKIVEIEVKAVDVKEVIKFADANMKDICVAQWDTDGDEELSEDEAVLVTSLGTIFKDNTTITSFNELKYFTGLASIEKSAFSGCTNLKSVELPETLTKIGDSAFKGCTSLSSIVIPEGVTNIGGSAFNGCTELASVELPASLTKIVDSAFRNCSSLTSVTIPDAVETIGINAFYGCSGLTSITLPKNLTTIGEAVLRGCSSLTSITIPEGVTAIEDKAFRDCSSLTTITIPGNVSAIGESVFKGCTNLVSVVSEIEKPFAFGTDAFTSISETCRLTVPVGTRSAYLSAGWTKDVFNGGVYEVGEEQPILVLGDVNSDGTVDISDYIGVANHILGNTPDGFNMEAADVNSDGSIDISDYIGVANIILTGKP